MNITGVLLSLFSGILLCFSFPNFIENTTSVHTSFFMWFAFVPVFYLVYNTKRIIDVLAYSLITGLVFYLAGLYWFCYVGPMGVFAYVAWAALCVYFAVLFAGTAGAAFILKQKFDLPYLLTLPSLFTFSEFVREWLFTGFPNLTPAQSQHQFTFILQLLKITGVYGLNFIIYFINAAIAAAIIREREELKKAGTVLSAAVFMILIVLTVAVNMKKDTFSGGVLKCAILQANIDQNVKWDAAFRINTLREFRQMTQEASVVKPDLYVWPETGFPGQIGADERARLEVSGWSKGAYNLMGSDRADFSSGHPKYYNSVYLISGKDILGIYSKYHLVPFGEYIPFQDAIPFVNKVVQRYGYIGFSRGVEIKPIMMNASYGFGSLICYDSFFPEISREFARKGAGFLTNLSYETWYGVSPASAQIFTNALLRAVENDLYFVRCVASGISGVADNRGRILKTTKLFTKDILICDIRVKNSNDASGSMTLYTKYGDWFPWAAIFLPAAVLAIRRKK